MRQTEKETGKGMRTYANELETQVIREDKTRKDCVKETMENSLLLGPTVLKKSYLPILYTLALYFYPVLSMPKKPKAKLIMSTGFEDSMKRAGSSTSEGVIVCLFIYHKGLT